MAPVNTVHRIDRDRQLRRVISALRRSEIEIKNRNAFVTLLRITLMLALVLHSTQVAHLGLLSAGDATVTSYDVFLTSL